MEDPKDRFMQAYVQGQDRIYGYIATLLPNRTDATDVFQQVSLILWKKWDEFDAGRNYVRWACGIAHNEVRNFMRRQTTSKPRVVLSEDVMLQVSQDRLDAEPLLDARRAALPGCMAKLTDDQRRLFEQFYADERPAKQLAEELRTTPNALYMTLRRIRQALLQCIDRTLMQESVK